jgi:hypothetical protein
MKATQLLHNLGQSLWLDNITRDLLDSGTLQRYIDELSVTGLTSNPTIFDHAIKGSTAYDASIRDGLQKGRSGEELFFDLALSDITRAADVFRSIHDRTNTVDGWVSLEVSPLLAHDTASTLAAARQLYARAARPNLLIKIPGTKEGLPAIEEAIFAGISVNVTLLFSREHYVAAADFHRDSAPLSDFFFVLHRLPERCAARPPPHKKAWRGLVSSSVASRGNSVCRRGSKPPASGVGLVRTDVTLRAWWKDKEKMGAGGFPCVLGKPAFIR